MAKGRSKVKKVKQEKKENLSPVAKLVSSSKTAAPKTSYHYANWYLCPHCGSEKRFNIRGHKPGYRLFNSCKSGGYRCTRCSQTIDKSPNTTGSFYSDMKIPWGELQRGFEKLQKLNYTKK